MPSHTGELSGSPYNLLAGRAIAIARKRSGMTQAKFGARVREKLTLKPTGRQAWGHIETGRAEISVAVLLASLDLAHIDWMHDLGGLFEEAEGDLKARDGAQLRKLRDDVGAVRRRRDHDPGGLPRRPADGRRAASK